MNAYILFILLSIPSLYFSWRTLFTIKSHGFYRFFGWECIIWLFCFNYPYWFTNPFSINQIFSWTLLFAAAYLAIAGSIMLLKHGKASHTREDETLFHFEKTTGLIQTGVYRFIRHPLYASLIYLGWGIYLKNPLLKDLIFAVLLTVFLYLTSRFDEDECSVYFGEDYRSYMSRSKMFIPFVF